VLRELGYDDQAISKITGVTGSAATWK
jgi:hypothetical protein